MKGCWLHSVIVVLGYMNYIILAGRQLYQWRYDTEDQIWSAGQSLTSSILLDLLMMTETASVLSQASCGAVVPSQDWRDLEHQWGFFGIRRSLNSENTKKNMKWQRWPEEIPVKNVKNHLLHQEPDSVSVDTQSQGRSNLVLVQHCLFQPSCRRLLFGEGDVLQQ